MPCCSRLATKAICAPVGDHAGWQSFSPQLVSWRGALPKVESNHRLAWLVLSSIEKRLTEHTACAPSGASDRLPTRSNFQRSSTVRSVIVV